MELWSAVRVVRAASFSATCAGLAALGHAAGGGRVAPSLVLAAFLLMFAPALALTRRERSLGAILPAVAVCQIAVHLLLSQACAQASAATAPAGTVPVDAVPDHAGALGFGTIPHGMAGHGAPPSPDDSSGPAMLLMHAVAVLVTSWWLEQGEAALCALVRCVAAWALRPLAWLSPPALRVAVPSLPFSWRRHPVPARVLRHVMARRGPPAPPIPLH